MLIFVGFNYADSSSTLRTGENWPNFWWHRPPFLGRKVKPIYRLATGSASFPKKTADASKNLWGTSLLSSMATLSFKGQPHPFNFLHVILQYRHNK